MLIRVFDLETTGFEPPHGVCEVAFVNAVSTTADQVGEPAGWKVEDGINEWLCNPGQPIPPVTSAVHHIIDEDVSALGPYEPIVRTICSSKPNEGGRQIFAAHNAKFEQQWLTPELAGAAEWICTYKCALRIWPDAPSHSNQGLRYWRRPEGLDRQVANVAHRAGPDAYVTAFLLRDMLNGGARIEDLVKWSSEPALQVICHIGKYRGTPWREVDTGFMHWVRERDFGEDVHFTIDTELERRRKEFAAANKREADSEDLEAFG
ncbi:DNA polymerase III subunit epsilon [Labrys neptuniae]